jgi:catechol 2,3-dioxygenase-like lactoylglutathione lyase family enzyme
MMVAMQEYSDGTVIVRNADADGVTVVERDDEDGYTSFKCLDPDGHRVEVYWEPPFSLEA